MLDLRVLKDSVLGFYKRFQVCNWAKAAKGGGIVEQGSTMVGKLTSGPNCPGFHSHRSPKKFILKIVYVAEVYQQGCSDESGQWLENVD